MIVLLGRGSFRHRRKRERRTYFLLNPGGFSAGRGKKKKGEVSALYRGEVDPPASCFKRRKEDHSCENPDGACTLLMKASGPLITGAVWGGKVLSRSGKKKKRTRKSRGKRCYCDRTLEHRLEKGRRKCEHKRRGSLGEGGKKKAGAYQGFFMQGNKMFPRWRAESFEDMAGGKRRTEGERRGKNPRKGPPSFCQGEGKKRFLHGKTVEKRFLGGRTCWQRFEGVWGGKTP